MKKGLINKKSNVQELEEKNLIGNVDKKITSQLNQGWSKRRYKFIKCKTIEKINDNVSIISCNKTTDKINEK